MVSFFFFYALKFYIKPSVNVLKGKKKKAHIVFFV